MLPEMWIPAAGWLRLRKASAAAIPTATSAIMMISLFDIETPLLEEPGEGAGGLSEIDTRLRVVEKGRGLVIARARETRLGVGDFEADGDAGIDAAAGLG